MKITLNLSPAASARDRFALGWAIPATIIGLAALVLMARATRHQYRDFENVRERVARVQQRTDELREQEAGIRRKLKEPAFQDVLHESQFVNQLIAQRQLSFSGLSARLAGLLPEDAHLTGLSLTAPRKSGDDYMIRMGITSKGEDAVETFINDLEDAPDFKDVSIVNQGFQEENSQGQQVNLICTARYLPEVDVNAEKPSAKESKTNRKPHH